MLCARFDRAILSAIILSAMIATQVIGAALRKEISSLFTAAIFAGGSMLLSQVRKLELEG